MQAFLRAQRDRLIDAEKSVRRGEPDGPFDFRTAVRRTRAALRTYQPLFADTAAAMDLLDELKWLGREVSAVRDAQVARERLSAGLTELDRELRRGPVESRLSRYFLRAEATAGAALLVALDSTRCAAIREKVDALCERPSFTRDAARPAAKELRVHLRTTAQALVEIVQRGDSSDAGLHAIRKTVRHLRESALVARPVVGRPAKRFDRRLQKLRRELGEHQDSVVCRRALADLVNESEQLGESSFTFGLLYGREWARAEAVRAGLSHCWRKVWRRKHVSWIDEELAAARCAAPLGGVDLSA